MYKLKKKKKKKTLRHIVRRFSDHSWGNLVHWWKQLCLAWKKKSWICSNLQFETIEAKPLPQGTSTQLVDLIALTRALELGKGKSSHFHWLQVCLSGATCTCGYLERKRPIDHPRVPNQIGDQILRLLEVVHLPTEVSASHCKGPPTESSITEQWPKRGCHLRSTE